MQRTLCILKPDAIDRNLQEKICQDIESAGFKILTKRDMHLTQQQAAKFYEEHKERGFFPILCENMTRNAITVMVLERDNAIDQWRTFMGATNPAESQEGTLRKKYGIDLDRNTLHGSDSAQSAQREIDFFFASCDLPL